MLEHIKICPKCGHHNPEWEEVCCDESCDQFLGMVEPIAASSVADVNQKVGTSTDGFPSYVPQKSDQQAAVTKRLLQPILYLEHSESSKIFEIHAGHIVGQAHPTSRAHIQMSNIPNINFVSREHCQFDFENGHWFVTAIRTATNPTYLNQLLIRLGERMPIKNGDRLLMSNVPFQVRVIES
ncbi:MAG: hypothetical protein BBJ57_05175 [Desulfobacterales bacterium PC51MH44]|nr:MAG: hypothetical protein BBJ57_05175 [Desulfobacterales bacterium PC51MH44]